MGFVSSKYRHSCPSVEQRQPSALLHPIDIFLLYILLFFLALSSCCPRSIPAPETLRPLQLRLVDFDKDIDDHMRVVAACSNLRARNYRIHEADLHKSRGIAGKIMPAIATTTALVSGLVCMEIFKLLQDMPMERFKSTFTNLAIPLFSGSEPNPPKSTTTTVKGAPWKWTPWDRIDITTPELTLDGLIALLEEQYGAELTMLSSGVTILYSNFMNKAKAKVSDLFMVDF